MIVPGVDDLHRPIPAGLLRAIRRAVDRGVRLSLGSDGHTFEQVADLSRPLTTARSLGVRDEDIYDPRRHGSKTGHFTR